MLQLVASLILALSVAACSRGAASPPTTPAPRLAGGFPAPDRPVAQIVSPTWSSGPELAWRECATDLRPERRLSFRIDSRGPTLEALVDRIALCGKARSLRRGGLLGGTRARNVSTAEATDNRGVLYLFGAEGACTHGR